MTSVRGPELDLLARTVDGAVYRANRGHVAGVHDELLYGLQRAEAARDEGEAWGAELVGHWTRALERFAREYRIGRA